MSVRNDKDKVETTGHEWDGIEEYNNPLPRWWVWVFYATIVWGLWYTVAYPAWPGLTKATAGYLGFSTRGEVEADISAVEAANADKLAALATMDIAAINADADMSTFAANAGKAVFNANCIQCHGVEGGGATGYPTLKDDDWLWGGTFDDIVYTVTNGIRNEQSPDTRGYGFEMMAYGDFLSKEEIAAVTQHVLSLSGSATDETLVAQGATVFTDQGCGSCHGDSGEGIPGMGAPVLNDAIWLYGGDVASVTKTITNGRKGAMPAWSDAFRAAGGGLSDAEIHAVAAYVHQLGGGE